METSFNNTIMKKSYWTSK